MEFRIVHLAEIVDELLEEVAALLEVPEAVFKLADVENEIEHIFLTLYRTEAVDCVECVLLEEDEVEKLRFPECLVISDRHAVVSEDVDLLCRVAALADDVLGLVHLLHPARLHLAVKEFLDFRILQILGIGVDRVDGRVSLLVCAVLLEGVEASCRLLGGLGHRLLEVTSRR